MILPVLAIILLVLLLIGLMFARIVVYPKRFGVQETYNIEKDNQKLVEAEYQSWEKEEFNIPSRFGYSLACIYFPIQGSKRCVVLSHGITYTRYGSVKYMGIFRKLGFNILIYDLRHHGNSGGKNTTFGFYEKHDLATLFDWLEQREGQGYPDRNPWRVDGGGHLVAACRHRSTRGFCGRGLQLQRHAGPDCLPAEG